MCKNKFIQEIIKGRFTVCAENLRKFRHNKCINHGRRYCLLRFQNHRIILFLHTEQEFCIKHLQGQLRREDPH